MGVQLKYCSNCLGNNITSKICKISPSDPSYILSNNGDRPLTYYSIYKGFVSTYTYKDNNICPTCNAKLIEMHLTEDEWIVLNKISLEQDFIFAMDELKQKDIIEFTAKMSQFKEMNKQNIPSMLSTSSQPSGVPKCPTCGSTNIKKISGAKRWLTTGVFGLASSDVGKTMECNSCGAKW